ncbi:hypothetical protein A2348_03960 [Candidatus Uhrbacteria bacterium RIFOXYB12_FULL_58_10]|uniref:Apea-like HEPN domain-containing protein n=1 Tax=Candidatus Uhrbacteria bacterium RIFOXYB2_FULL_57_15 TaxID=1802422 RepID=A0A1F7W4R7_9BACT|nr:MAG: hypothetical protein A2348_03960 [Candidatus Uhrbacteria bacterium RIFOXYB12_FULL_58_10]OGL97750.1 MAG: hypothetical protein A2304_00600 [Candidatus Uhrbacteria bacterium RIFOXYB2_FULL_57_15]OGL99607.1 MAG: hypothetical protein A2501_00160 [Candidatus Uhrbacteria bacterium RIFOXYC12_FULL_57_11]
MTNKGELARQPNDNRMAWIRNIESLTSDKKGSYVVECEFLSEARISSVLSYADGMIQCGGLEFEKDENGLYRYLLRLEHAGIKDPSYNKFADKDGYYFKDGILGELLAIFSLFFQARFYPIATYMGELTPTSLPSRHGVHLRYQKPILGNYPEIFDKNKTRRFSELQGFLDMIRGIPPQSHHVVIRAIDHYARALREIGVDTEMVFIRLVSSIEALSGDFAIPTEQNPLHGANYAIFDDVELSDRQRKQLREMLKVDKTGSITVDKSKKKFLGFLDTYSVGCLRGGNRKAKHCKIYRKDVPKYLRSIYDARSCYLHDGLSMYISEQYAAAYNWDVDPGLGMTIDNHQFSGSSKLPHPSWFENMVRHALMKYMNALASGTGL